MKFTPKIAGTAVAALALAGAGIGTAVAAGASASVRAPAVVHAVQSERTSPDNDAIQSGDQTSPDGATAAAARAHSVTADNPGEAASSENGPSDGPGGHADASGDVQHEFDGVE
jgi:hypothetical protein